MKRQRGVNVNVNVNNHMMNNPPKVEDMAPNAAMGKKKAKKEGEQKVVGKSVVVEDQERNKESNKEVGGAPQGGGGDSSSVMGWSWEEHMPWLQGGVVDEQMSWGSTWFPGWDMDFMGEAFSALYSDVVWDDDIWNLKKEIPIPLDRMRFDWG